MVVVRAVTCLVLGVRSFAADVLMPNGCAFYNDIMPSAGRSRQTCRNPRGRLWDVLLLELTERIQFSAPDSYPKQRFSDAAEFCLDLTITGWRTSRYSLGDSTIIGHRTLHASQVRYAFAEASLARGARKTQKKNVGVERATKGKCVQGVKLESH